MYTVHLDRLHQFTPPPDMVQENGAYLSSQISDSTDILAEQANVLHRIIMKLMLVYAILYTIIDFSMLEFTQGLFDLSMFPSLALVWWLDKKGYDLYSKIWNVISIDLILFGVSVYAGADIYNFAFYLPVIVGALIIFQGENKAIGYVLSVISIGFMLVTVFSDVFIGHPKTWGDEGLVIEQITNLIGACLVIILEIGFILRVNFDMQKKLLDQSLRLTLSNSQLKTTLYTRDKMLSVLTHDLRSPLITVNGGLVLMQSGNLHPSAHEKTLKQMLTKSKSVIQLIDRILMWTRSQTQTISYQEEIITLNEVKEMIKTICELLESEKLVHFKTEIALDEMDSFRGDINMIESILRNLISNAIKFSNPDGEIIISIEEKDDFFVFSVSDFGVGMNSADLKKLQTGEAFSNKGTESEKGHGIGLQIVSDFLKKHGSSLDIQSLEGRGSKFSFRLRKNKFQ